MITHSAHNELSFFNVFFKFNIKRKTPKVDDNISNSRTVFDFTS